MLGWDVGLGSASDPTNTNLTPVFSGGPYQVDTSEIPTDSNFPACTQCSSPGITIVHKSVWVRGDLYSTSIPPNWRDPQPNQETNRTSKSSEYSYSCACKLHACNPTRDMLSIFPSCARSQRNGSRKTSELYFIGSTS
jgi:hypothetical protein